MRNAAIVSAGVSSMKSGKSCNSRDARESSRKSSREILPIRSNSELIPDCSAKIRVASWSADISRLKKATFAPAPLDSSMPSSRSRTQRRAALKAILVASEVLPMPGRPARITRSELCKPPHLALMLFRPVVMPERLPPEFSAFSTFLIASVDACKKLFIEPVSPSPSATLYSALSAASICPLGSTLSLVSSALSTSVRPTVTNSRNNAKS